MPEYVFLIRDLSEEGKLAEILLKKKGFEYYELVANTFSKSPVLITNESRFSYTGLDEIEEYLSSFSDERNEENKSINL